MRPRLLVVTMVLAAGFTACGDDPPSSPSGPSRILKAISIQGPPEVAPGSTTQFTAMATYTDGSTSDVTSTAGWSTQGTSNLRSVGRGLFEAVTVGEGRVGANAGGRSTSRPVLVLLPGTYKLSGTVTDASGSVDGVDVEVLSGTGAGQRARSRFDGSYTLYGVAGQVQLRASAPGYVTQDFEVTVGSHTTRDVNLTTSIPPVDVSGQWTLKVSTSSACSESWPAAARQREVGAVVTQQGTGLTIKFQNVPSFVYESKGRIAGDVFSLELFFDFYYLDWGLMERLSPTEWVGVNGVFTGTASESRISGQLAGNFDFYQSAANAQFPSGAPRICSADPTFEFRR